MVSTTTTTPVMMNGMAIAWKMMDVGSLFIALRLSGPGQDERKLSGSEHQFQMGAVKPEPFAYLVFQIALVSVVYQPGVVHCKKEGGRVYPNLLEPVDLHPLAPVLPDTGG